MTKPAPFIWHDLMTTDVKAAEAFYSAVAGWRIADSGMPGMSYAILKAGDVEVGGIMGMPEGFGMPPMWNGYIYSPDVDADSRRATELGGSVCKAPEDIPGVGRFSVIADPGGATINLFRPNSDATPKDVAAGTPGHFVWNDLSAGELGREWRFYAALFGWSKTEAMPMGPDAVYQMFATGKEPVGGMMTKSKDQPAVWTYFISTGDIAAARQRILDHGGRIVTDLMQVPGGEWILVAADPQGAKFGLVGPKK